MFAIMATWASVWLACAIWALTDVQSPSKTQRKLRTNVFSRVPFIYVLL